MSQRSLVWLLELLEYTSNEEVFNKNGVITAVGQPQKRTKQEVDLQHNAPAFLVHFAV